MALMDDKDGVTGTGAKPHNMAGAARGMRLCRWIPLGVLVVGLIAFFVFDLGRFLSFETLQLQRDTLQSWVAEHPFAARLSYAAIYAHAIAFSLPIGLLLTITGGFLFGLVEGTVLTLVAATVGAVAVFLAARTALGASLRARAGPFVARLEAGFKQDALSYLLVLRLVPLFPFWLVNIVPALLGVPVRVYAIATFLGIIPGTVVFISVGNGLDHLVEGEGVPGLEVFLEPGVLLPIVGLVVLSLIPIIYKRWKSSRVG